MLEGSLQEIGKSELILDTSLYARIDPYLLSSFVEWLRNTKANRTCQTLTRPDLPVDPQMFERWSYVGIVKIPSRS